MQRFETRKQVFQLRNALISALVFILIFLVFLYGISTLSSSSTREQQATLEKALREGTVQTYALRGYYPRSLDELQKDYSITYDQSKFIVNYQPHGENIMPDIRVIEKQ